MINGNITGIKDYKLKELEKLFQLKVEKNKIISEEIVEFISKFSSEINREINIGIDRNGNIVDISIGNHNTVSLPSIKISEKKLAAIRLVHTHPSGNPHLSLVDISALLNLKLDCITSIGVIDGKITGYEVGFCDVISNKISSEKIFLKEIFEFQFLEKIKKIEEDLKNIQNTDLNIEKAILVGIEKEEFLDELEELARACDIKVVGRFFQTKKNIDPLFLIGSGKIKELSLYKQINDANLLIFDEELSGLQIKNIEEATACKTIDRTTLILEIFARRAKSRESKLQVELAQLKYRSNRLIGLGISMSRLGGGVGTKGPGEKKLEIDRRLIKKNIIFLKNELEEIRKIKNTQREKRISSGIPKVSLVGYTNVGKSTIRNMLVELYPSDNSIKKENVLSKDMLFATLDTTTRTIQLENKTVISLTDTVGFIKKLPHDLIESFKTTLEEVIFSDLIIHVADSSSKNIYEEVEAVENVLKELNCLEKTKILLLNKCELISEDEAKNLENKFKNYEILFISAKEKYNVHKIRELISKNLNLNSYKCKLLIPYNQTNIQAILHKNATILEEKYLEEGIYVKAILKEREYNLYNSYIKGEEIE